MSFSDPEPLQHILLWILAINFKIKKSFKRYNFTDGMQIRGLL